MCLRPIEFEAVECDAFQSEKEYLVILHNETQCQGLSTPACD